MYALAQKQYNQDREKEDVPAQAEAIAESLRFLANIASYHGDDTLARRLYEESLAFSKELDYREHIVSCLESLASFATEQGQPIWASRLYRLAVSLDSLAPSRSSTYESKPSTGVRESTALLIGSASAARYSTSYPAGLTAREVEVLRLVAQGLTDLQVAGCLVISPRTVNYHLTSIYKKIQVSSRCAATRYAIEHHLI